jgi:hypothetical protein
MSLLGKAGLAKPLDEAGINIYGYVEGGYFHDFTRSSPSSGPTYIQFNHYKNAAILDKVSLNVERTVDPTKKKFDLGKEGGHSKRRIMHAKDFTGQEVERILADKAEKDPRIKIFENHIAIDLITQSKFVQEKTIERKSNSIPKGLRLPSPLNPWII